MKNNLKKIRKKKKIKQSKLASDLNISRQTIWNIENQQFQPKIDLVYQICTYFKIEINDFFDFKDNKK